MNNISKLAILMFWFSGIPSVQAQQAASVTDAFTWKVSVEPVELFQGQGIPFLEWSQKVYAVENVSSVNYANLKGRFTQKVSGATVNGRAITLDDAGRFNLRLEFMGEEKTFILSVVDQNQHTYRMQYRVGQDQVAQSRPEQNRVGSRPEENKKRVGTPPSFRWRYGVGAGYSLISYRQANVDSFDQKVITLKGSVVYRLVPEKWDLNAGAFFNAVSLSTTSPTANKIRYLGLNGRVGYHVIDSPSPLRLNLYAGFYFNTSYGPIGFADMYGPQIAPEFTYVFDNGDTLFWYGKYAHSLSGSEGLSLKNNREVAAGVHYSFPITLQNRLSIGVDLSQLNLSLDQEWASTTAYSFSAGLSF